MLVSFITKQANIFDINETCQESNSHLETTRTTHWWATTAH